MSFQKWREQAMTSPSIFSNLVFLISLIAYGIAIASTGSTYRKYRYLGHAWITFGFALLLLDAIIRYVIEFTPSNEGNLLLILWFLLNSLLMLSVWVILLSLLLGQYDRLPKRSHFITLLVGILIGLFSNPNFIRITKDPYSYNAKYDPIIGVFVLILLILFITSVVRQSLIKLRLNPHGYKRPPAMLLLISYVLIIVWALSILFTSNPIIRTARPALFAIAMLFWGLALYLNPLTISITSVKTKGVYVLRKDGLLLCFWEKGGKSTTVDRQLLSNLMTAIKASSESLVGGNSVLRGLAYQDSHISFVAGKKTIVSLITEGVLSSNLELVARVYLADFERRYSHLLADDIINTSHFANESTKIGEIIESMTM